MINLMFVVFEGITSTGKTTIARMLVDRLNASGRRAVLNHEPTDSYPFGKIVRALINGRKLSAAILKRAAKTNLIPQIVRKLRSGKKLTALEFQMLYLADRKMDLEKNILPKLSHGKWIIQDRYEMSTFAFGAAGGVSLKKLTKMQEKIVGKYYLKPDIVFYFDVKPEIAMKRLAASGKIIDIFETLPRIKKTQAAYKKILKNKKFYRKLYIVDVSQPIHEVFHNVVKMLEIV